MTKTQQGESWHDKFGFDLAFWGFNGLALSVILAFGIFAKAGGSWFKRIRVVYALFDETEPIFDRPYLGLFTHVSEVVLCLAAAFCLFAFHLLHRLRPRSPRNSFFLISAIFLLIFATDDLFRLTLILQVSYGIPKIIAYCLYGAALGWYLHRFRRRIALTYYPLLMIASLFLIVSGVADLIQRDGTGISSMLWGILEDSAKLIGIINLTLYFWHVCQQEVFEVFKAEQ